MTSSPGPLRPTGDVLIDGWTGDDGSISNLYLRLGGVGDVRLLSPVAEFNVIHFGDDTRFDDLFHVLKSTAPYRANQAAIADVQTLILQPGIRYPMARMDIAYCGPARFSLISGNFATNHGVYDTGILNYYLHGRKGDSAGFLWAGGPSRVSARCMGPWEIDLAYKLGAYLVGLSGADAVGLALESGARVSTASVLAHAGLSAGGLVQGPARRRGFSTTTGLYGAAGNTTDGSPVQLVDTFDDLQAFTGGLNTTLGRPAILDFNLGVGKMHNGTGATTGPAPFNATDSNGVIAAAKTNRWVPSGFSHACFLTDDVQDHFRFRTVEYTGTLTANPGTGDGAVGDCCYYNSIWQISSASWSGGHITIVLANEPGYYKNGVFQAWHPIVGDEIAIRRVQVAGSQNNGYNAAVAVVDSVSVDGKTITYSLGPSNPGTATLPNPATNPYAHVVIQKMTEPAVMYQRAIDAHLDAGVSRTTKGLVYWGSRMPHMSGTDYNTDATFVGLFGASLFNQYDLDVNPRYRDPKLLDDSDAVHGGVLSYAVDYTSGFAWEGVPGAKSPAVVTVPTTAQLAVWARRGCMLAIQNDYTKLYHDQLATYRGTTVGGRAWTDWWVGDNGWQQNEDYGVEHATGVTGINGGKAFNREGSQRLQYAVRRPAWGSGVLLTRQPTVADIPLTLLDFYGLTSHQMHDTRDGISLARSENNRAILGWGLYLGTSDPNESSAQAIVRSDRYILRRLQATPATFHVENIAPSNVSIIGASADWGVTDWAGALGSTVTNKLQTQLDALQYAGWDPVGQHNSFHDAVLP